MKIPFMAAEFFHADAQTNGQTDRTNIIVAFRKFCERT